MRQRDKIILSSIAAVIALGGFWMLALSPKLKESKELSAKIAKKKKAIDGAKEDTPQPVKQQKVDYAATYATLAKLGKAVPVAGSVDDDVPSLLLQLNKGSKVTKTGFQNFEVDSTPASGAAPAAAASSATPSQQGSAGGGAATGTTGAAGSGSTDASGGTTLSEVKYKYTYFGTLYDLENLMAYLTDMVKVDGQRLKVSGRLLAIQSIDFAIASANTSNPLLQTNVSVVSYTTPEGSSLVAGGAPAAGTAAPQTAATGSGSNSADQVPGAPPQAQPATPPSASLRRP